MTTLSSPAIYVRCSSGFGNKIFDLISAIYLKNKYNMDVYFAIDKSIHDDPDDPFFGNIFYKSYTKIKYIYMKKYYRLEKSLPIGELWISDLDKLPEKILTNIRFSGLYRFAYLMYSTFDDFDKNLFEINPKVLDSKIYEKYIVQMNSNYACVHIRYGDKLCYGLEEFKQTKYTPYMLPIYTPNYYIDQINELLKKNLSEILVMTDSIALVEKYIIDKFKNNPRVVLFNSHYIDSFYLLTKAQYIIMSYSTFSFAAGYFNPIAMCYLVKKYVTDKEKDYVYEDDAISPKWLIIDDKDYILNFNQKLLKEMVIYYANCNKYIKNLSGGNQNDFNDNAKTVKNQILDDFVNTGPITITKTRIGSKLVINGTLNFHKLFVGKICKVYGSVYGDIGNFNKFNVYGRLEIRSVSIEKLLCYGEIYAEKISIKNKASIVGQIYIINSNIENIEIVSNQTKFNKCDIGTLIINNNDKNPRKILIENSKIDEIIIIGNLLDILADSSTRIGKIINGTILIDL